MRAVSQHGTETLAGMTVLKFTTTSNILADQILPNMRPDPKLLFDDGVMYHKEKKKAREKRLTDEAR